MANIVIFVLVAMPNTRLKLQYSIICENAAWVRNVLIAPRSWHNEETWQSIWNERILHQDDKGEDRNYCAKRNHEKSNKNRSLIERRNRRKFLLTLHFLYFRWDENDRRTVENVPKKMGWDAKAWCAKIIFLKFWWIISFNKYY